MRLAYLAAVPEAMAHELIRLIGDRFEHLLNELIGEITPTETSDVAEIEAIIGRTDIGATTKSQLGVWAAEGIENRIENFYLSERLRLHYFDPAKGSSTPENIVF